MTEDSPSPCDRDLIEVVRDACVEAAPGDFALHYGDGMHAGPPPTGEDGPFRVSIVSEYGPRGRTAEQGQEHYDQLMHEVDPTVLK